MINLAQAGFGGVYHCDSNKYDNGNIDNSDIGHPGLGRLVAKEGSTTVTLARVLSSLRQARADH